ncbi:caspase-1 [Cherax quadricarinatus]|uniref:caspase-1 n=1 Tax=Cherax quadricarinatus TaxID=27406 RepID=UPI0023785DF4|nr:caspase-1-like [Cherax quadricarinatus]
MSGNRETTEVVTTSKNSDEEQEVIATATQDTSDVQCMTQNYRFQLPYKMRPEAVMPVASDSTEYNMKHVQRGHAIIFAFNKFHNVSVTAIPSVEDDVKLCSNAFMHLGFRISIEWNLSMQEFSENLRKVAKKDHSICDALVIVVVSQGGWDDITNNEYICTSDDTFYTRDIWNYFTPEKCPSLAGKPKLFFIEAWRGNNVEKGVLLKPKKALSVQVDSKASTNEDYVIPLYADTLVFWASYPGMRSFISKRNNMKGSVFLHYLAQVLTNDSSHEDLTSMLLTITRRVATEYESRNTNRALCNNKQIPYTVSTLMRQVRFYPKYL